MTGKHPATEMNPQQIRNNITGHIETNDRPGGGGTL